MGLVTNIKANEKKEFFVFRYLILNNAEPDHNKIKHGYDSKENIEKIFSQFDKNTHNFYVSINSKEQFNALVFDVDDHGKPEEDSLEIINQKIQKLIEHAKQTKQAIKVNSTGRGAALIFQVSKNDLAKRNDINELYKHCWQKIGGWLKSDFGFKLDEGPKDYLRVFRVSGTINTRTKTECKTMFFQEGTTLNVEELLEDYNQAKEGKNEKLPEIKSTEIETVLKNKKDYKLQGLLDGNISGYKSRSEAEIALIQKLNFYSLSKEQVFEVMAKYSKIGKWNDAPEQYKELTYNKALELSASTGKQEKIVLEFKTAHLKNFEDLLNASNLIGKAYTLALKALWYQLVGVPLATKTVSLGKVKADMRESLTFAIVSGNGKNLLRTCSEEILTKGKFKVISPTSYHAEQFVGKMLPVKDKGKIIKWEENKGHFDSDLISIDEALLLLQSNDKAEKDVRAKIAQALNIYKKNFVYKRSVDNKVEEALGYYPSCVFQFFIQPLRLPENLITQGFLRRPPIIFVDISKEPDTRYTDRWGEEDSSEKGAKTFSELIFEVSDWAKNKEFNVTPETLEVFKKLDLAVLDFGRSHSRKANNAMTVLHFTMQERLLRMATLLAASNKEDSIRPCHVILAFLDLIEILSSELDFLENFVTGDFSYGLGWKGITGKKQELLRWLYDMGATTMQESNVTIADFKEQICKVYNIKDRQAVDKMTSLRDDGLIQAKKTQVSSIVWLNFSPEVSNLRKVQKTQSVYAQFLSKYDEIQKEFCSNETATSASSALWKMSLREADNPKEQAEASVQKELGIKCELCGIRSTNWSYKGNKKSCLNCLEKQKVITNA